jgi:hypothetical protein
MGLYDRLGTTPNQSLRSCAEPRRRAWVDGKRNHGLDYIPTTAGRRPQRPEPAYPRQAGRCSRLHQEAERHARQDQACGARSVLHDNCRVPHQRSHRRDVPIEQRSHSGSEAYLAQRRGTRHRVIARRRSSTPPPPAPACALPTNSITSGTIAARSLSRERTRRTERWDVRRRSLAPRVVFARVDRAVVDRQADTAHKG